MHDVSVRSQVTVDKRKVVFVENREAMAVEPLFLEYGQTSSYIYSLTHNVAPVIVF